jgi:hypothetical protein
MAALVFLEYGADGTIRTGGLHWEDFPRLAWEALSAAGYTIPQIYEVAEFERLGVPRCMVIVTRAASPGSPRVVRCELCVLGFLWPRYP